MSLEYLIKFPVYYSLKNTNSCISINGILNYSATYTYYAYSNVIKACIDLDGDGILDVKDVDDDNDGIIDGTESPTCFYSAGEAATIINVTSDLIPYDRINYTIDKSYDNNMNTHSAFVASQNIANKTLWEITPTAPIPITSIFFDMGGANISFNNKDKEGKVNIYPKVIYLRAGTLLTDEVKVYPNPATSKINMDYYSATGKSTVHIYITDMAGRIIKSIDKEIQTGKNTLQINVSDLADGSYLIDYHNMDNGNTGKVKFVKDAQ